MKTTLVRAARVGTFSALVLAGSTGAASAQVGDLLVKAKALYAEASYEDALKVLDGGQGPEAHQYRALCLIALGRTQDAEQAIESLIQTSPMFTVSEADLPPRLVTLFAHTRARVMPDVVRRLFSEGRDAFQAKQLDRARGKFDQVLTLLRDPSMSAAPDAKDLELLTTGYLDIVKNTPPPAPVPVKVPAASLAAAPAPAPVAPRPPVVTPPPPRPVVITPAVTIRQTIPAYTSTIRAGQGTRTGSVRVVIGTDGTVKAATIVEQLEPRYDAQLRAEAMSWQYEPAKRGGEPIESEKVVSVTVGQP